MSSVSGSSTVNGLYSNPNQISGLVSGLDTESMIEGLVDSYNQKIIGYQQDIVKMQWQQEAYRDVSNDLNVFLSKYMSYSSPETNIFSASFFNNAVTTTAGGANASAVTVTGSSDSTVTVDSVLQTATSARVETSALTSNASSDSITASTGVDLSSVSSVGNLSGSMAVSYGSSKFTFNFTSSDVIDQSNGETQGQAFANLLNDKLQEAGNTDMEAKYNESTGELSFVAGATGDSSNSYWISSCSSSVASTLGVTANSSASEADKTISFSKNLTLTKNVDNLSLVSGKDITITFNDVSRTLTMPTIIPNSDGSYNVGGTTVQKDALNDQIISYMNEELGKLYGSSINVSNEADDGTFQLQFNIENSGTNTLHIASSIGETLNLGEVSTNYVNTSDSLETILGSTWFDNVDSNSPMTANGTVTLNSAGSYYYDSDGDRVQKHKDDNGDEVWYKVDDTQSPDGSGNYPLRMGESLSINGVEVGVFDSESKLSDVLSAINSSEAGVTASFSTLTNKIVFTTNDMGSSSNIEFDDSALSKALFGDSSTHKVTEGQDAIALVTVNGEQIELVRSTNTFSLDGLSVTLNNTFNTTDKNGDPIDLDDYKNDDGSYSDLSSLWSKVDTSDAITFTEETDISGLVEVISGMVDDYNSLMSKIKTYFTEIPLTNTSGGFYEPLTDEDSSSMSESAVTSYEEKAKTGILFGDTNMRNLYSSLSSVFSSAGPFGADLSAMGIDLLYGQSTSKEMVSLDTEKLTQLLSTDLDRVKNAFISSTGAGSSSDGIMQTMKTKMEMYGSTTGATKGILVEAAGSELSSLSLLSNTMQTKIDNFNKLIETWEEKLSDKVTYYTSKFSSLEVLMSQANSQLSSLSGLSGY